MRKTIIPIALLSILLTACGGGQNNGGGVVEGSLCGQEGERAQDSGGSELLCQVMGDGKLVWNQSTPDSSSSSAGATPSSSCPTPLLQTPVDLSKVTSILYPGQERGGNYKAHGGFGVDNATDNLLTVTIPLNGKITRVVRYKEIGEIQYLFEFEGDCGVSFKFDHLRKLTPKFEAIVNAFPIKEDTRTDPVNPPVPVMVGEVIATEVGFLNNVSVDFGVYDMRQKNEASKDPAWASAHSQFPADSYGICWFDSLPEADSAIVKSLPSRDGSNSGQTSDYCK
jgi:major membrane immunogen (membrane-anchored lipoprotein)